MTSTTELPGFGANFDNRSQQAVILESYFRRKQSEYRIDRGVETIDGSTSQNDAVNDFVGQASAFREVGFGGQNAGAPRGLPRKAIPGSEIPLPATPMTRGTPCTKSATPTAWEKGRQRK